MEKSVLNVPNISCGHCVMSIQNELSEMEGVSQVSGDPDSKTITVAWEAPANIEKIRKTLAEINYPAEG
ncbi:MAG: heavy-metal-associated domain-containing protein [Desulfobacteraceae bacterium]|jgi:copper chaperone CopZ|nr:heavy-metal-associated domain-containing protein [Desulfobacteraceae bacterium]